MEPESYNFDDVSMEAGNGDVQMTPAPGTSAVEMSPAYATPLSRSGSQPDERAGSIRDSVGLLFVREGTEYCRGVIKLDGPIKWCTKSPKVCAARGPDSC